MVHKRPVKTAHTLVTLAVAPQVARIMAVLAMQANRHARRPGGYLHFQRRQVAAVHNVRTQLPKQPKQFSVLPDAVAWRFVQGNKADIGGHNALAKISDVGQSQHGVAVGIGGHVVDQVDDAVLQPTGVKAVHDVQHKGSGIGAQTNSPPKYTGLTGAISGSPRLQWRHGQRWT